MVPSLPCTSVTICCYPPHGWIRQKCGGGSENNLGAPKGLERLRWALAPLPAGVCRVLEGLTAGKRQASTPRKSYWDGRWALVCFGAFARGVRGTKKAFGGFGGLDGWQTAGFNAKKKLFGWALVPFPAGKRQAFAPRKAIRMGLGAFWMVCVNAKKKILGWAMGFGAFACGVRGTKKAFGGFGGFWGLWGV